MTMEVVRTIDLYPECRRCTKSTAGMGRSVSCSEVVETPRGLLNIPKRIYDGICERIIEKPARFLALTYFLRRS